MQTFFVDSTSEALYLRLARKLTNYLFNTERRKVWFMTRPFRAMYTDRMCYNQARARVLATTSLVLKDKPPWERDPHSR